MSISSMVEAEWAIDPTNYIGCGDNVVICSVFLMTFKNRVH
jgi:hypothetical protein